MKRSRFSEWKILGILKEHEAGARVDELCRRQGDAVHMAATDQVPMPNNALATRELSTHGSSTMADGR